MLDRMEYDEWLALNINNRHKDTVQTGCVVSTTFFAVRKSDNKIIGVIDIRHNMEIGSLMQYCGHLGVSICPSERNGLYFKEMMEMATEYIKTLNINKVLIGCTTDNMQSNRLIPKMGGKLVDTKECTSICGDVPHAVGKYANIYCIDLLANEEEVKIPQEIIINQPIHCRCCKQNKKAIKQNPAIKYVKKVACVAGIISVLKMICCAIG